MTDLTKLAEPFAPADVEWRIGQSGSNAKGIWAKCLAYITNRAIMERLDTVCGPQNWKNEYREWQTGTPGVLCGISIRVDNEWVTKWDGAEQTDVEAMKGGLSAAMKRAGVQWGIGRYLYDLPEGWAVISDSGKNYGKLKDGTVFHWDPPAMPGGPEQNGQGKAHYAAPQARQAEPAKTAPAAGPNAPTEKQIAFYERLALSSVFTEDERQRAMAWLKEATRQTIKDQIDWLKGQVESRPKQSAEKVFAPADEPEMPPWMQQ